MNRTAEETLRPMQNAYPVSPKPTYSTTTSFLKSKAMKLWPSGPTDQTTPKADPKSGRLTQEINPFDAAIVAASSPGASPGSPNLWSSAAAATVPASSPTSVVPTSPHVGNNNNSNSATSASTNASSPHHLHLHLALPPSPGVKNHSSKTNGPTTSAAKKVLHLPSLSLPTAHYAGKGPNSPGAIPRASGPTTAVVTTPITSTHFPAPASPVTPISPVDKIFGGGTNTPGTPTTATTNTAVKTSRAPPPPSIVLPPPSSPLPPPLDQMSPAAVIAAAAAAGASNGVTTPSSSKPPLRRNQTATPGTPSSSHPRSNHPRGQLHVKVLQARGLNVASNQSRPYVVVQFEQSEFVSREPIASEMEKEVKGKAGPLSRTSSALALPSLAGAANASMMAGGGISRAFDKAAKATTAGAPPTTGSKLSGIPRSSGSSNSSSDESTGPSTTASSSRILSNGNMPSGLLTPRILGPASGSGYMTPGGSLFGVMSPHNPVWKHEVSFDVTSDEALVYLNIYDRTPECDEFIGALEFKPVLVHDHTVDRWYSLQARENEVVTGEIRLQMTYEHIKSRRALTPKDFDFLKLIGRGTFGKVFQVRKKDTRRIYAMKVLSKKEIIAKKEVAHTIGERKILQRSLECPFLVGLKFSFQTERDLYLVTDFKSGGELFYHLQRETKFTEDRARFYIAELVLALEHLHKYDIMYRDLKPENILLDATGHVALCDFGLSKPDLGNGQLTNTFCGTTEYLAPEVLLDDQGYSKTVDFWSLGVLLFEMCCGWSPFYAEDVQQMYKNICFGRIKFPRGVIGEDGKQFVKGLLNRNPKNRLGAQRDTAELKEHPFFKSIDWVALGKKQVTPPFKPQVTSDESTENFDVEFTNADLRDTGIDIFDSDDEGDDDDGWAVNTVATDGLSTSGTTISSENGSPVGSINSSSPGKAANATASVGAGDASSKLANGDGLPKKPILTKDKSNSTKNHKHGMRGGIPETPISSSIQDHFRGFTFQGESTLDEAMRLVGEEDVFAHEGEDYGEAGGDDEDEWEDEEPVGRYQGKKQEVGYFD